LADSYHVRWDATDWVFYSALIGLVAGGALLLWARFWIHLL
jgi:hypothetical protein